MPQILRRPNDTITVTVDGSNARFPTAVVLPELGSRIDQAEKVLVSSTTNVGRWCWDKDEGADATVASSFPMGAAGTVHPISLPPRPRTSAEAALQRHVMTLKITTVLADGDKITFSDGEGNSITLEADPSNNGVTGGNTEIGTNAATKATQATGIVAALLAWGSGARIRAEVDAEDSEAIVLMGHTNAKNITITTSLSTGVISTTDYGRNRPILYVLSATTSTAISVATVGNA